MDKLRMQSSNGVEDNIAKIAQSFPDCVTEAVDANGRLTHLIDFEKLKQNLSGSIISEKAERYQFTWPDKSKAILLANSPVNATLRPCREESVDFDHTQNLYIEGDNLDVLKCLKETYLHKVKMIYIDPPYNTGNDFVYEDDFAQTTDEYLANSGQYDHQGNRMVTNAESNGRFHTDWLNMIYPRIKVARDLLTDDGVIFISIDDNEVENLKKVCDEIFGEQCVECYVWDVREPGTMPKTAKLTVRKEHEYIIACFRSQLCKRLKKYASQKYINADWTNADNDPRGAWMSANISRGSEGSTGGSKSFVITNPAGISFDRDWAVSKDEYEGLLADGRIYFADNGKGVPRRKIFKTDIVYSTQSSIFEGLSCSQTQAKENKSLLGGNFFDFPKPIKLIIRFLQIASDKDSLILDFFSGSATTAHAVMQLNAEDKGNRKFIMVQLPEKTDDKSEAYKAGYKNICEIGKERIRRAGKKIKEESPLTTQDLDTGFRVLKLDSSNMEDVYYSPKDTDQRTLFNMVDNVKPDRTGEDLLFQVMLELGATLDSKIETTTVAGKTLYDVADGYLVACFDRDVSDEVVKTIAQMQPTYAVLRDTSMADDATATNFEQIFKTYSPNTTTRIL